MNKKLVGILIGLGFCFLTVLRVYGQNYHAFYDFANDQIRVCIDDQMCLLSNEHIRLKVIDHFKVNGDSIEVRKQLEELLRFSKKNKKLRIRTIEYEDSNVHQLDTILHHFDYFSVLVINNCKNLKLAKVVSFINQINTDFNKKYPKNFKKRFRKRPSIFYLNSLILKNQKLDQLGSPDKTLKPFNYLEELRIESPTDDSPTQEYINDLIKEWIVRDTVHYLNSFFPNIRYLGFKNCQLDSLPIELKYRRDLVSLDLSGNQFEEIPKCIQEYVTFNTMLSLNLSNNLISKLDSVFLDRFTSNRPRNKKFLKYLFLSQNSLSYDELKSGLCKKKYKNAFNTLSFECNPIEIKEFTPTSAILELAKELDEFSIAKFMTGAQRSETDFNSTERLFINCNELLSTHL